MIFGFWAYHFFYLTFTNTTTNETFKWKHVQDVFASVQKYVNRTSSKENDPTALHQYLYGPVVSPKDMEVRKADKGDIGSGDKEAEKKQKIKVWFPTR
jgi:hypothetical protein